MRDDDAGPFTAALIAAGENWNETLSEIRIASYFETLKRFEIEPIKAALARAFQTCTYFPKPAELIAILEGTPEDRAALAWARAERALARYGPYQSLDFQDPVLHRLIRHYGGWEAFAHLLRLPDRERGFQRTEFLALHAIFADTPEEAPTEVGVHWSGKTFVLGPGPNVPVLSDRAALPPATRPALPSPEDLDLSPPDAARAAFEAIKAKLMGSVPAAPPSRRTIPGPPPAPVPETDADRERIERRREELREQARSLGVKGV